MSKGLPNLVVVSGPSGAGKSTVLGRVLAEQGGIRFSISHTTRAPRPGERDGVQYHFADRATFESMIAAEGFLEWAEVHKNLYGTSLREYERAQADGIDLLLDLDVQGAAQVRARFPEAVTVFIIPPSYADLERRLRGRGHEGEESFQRRLAAAHRELALYPKYEYAIINEHLDDSVESLKSVIRAARCRTTRIDGEARRILGTFEK